MSTYRKMAGKVVTPEMRRLVIADFYQKNAAKEKSFTATHFKRTGYKKMQVYAVMQRVDRGESVAQRKGQGAPRKLSIAQERKVKEMMNNKNANEGPYATFR